MLAYAIPPRTAKIRIAATTSVNSGTSECLRLRRVATFLNELIHRFVNRQPAPCDSSQPLPLATSAALREQRFVLCATGFPDGPIRNPERPRT